MPHTKFVEIGFLKGFCHIGAWRPSWSCDQAPASCHQIFISLYLKTFIQILVQIDVVFCEKIQFEILYVNNLGPMSRNDIDLQYSLTFINSIRCLLLPTFRSLAAIVSEKSTAFSSSNGKAQVTKFDLAVK